MSHFRLLGADSIGSANNPRLSRQLPHKERKKVDSHFLPRTLSPLVPGVCLHSLVTAHGCVLTRHTHVVPLCYMSRADPPTLYSKDLCSVPRRDKDSPTCHCSAVLEVFFLSIANLKPVPDFCMDSPIE